MRILVVEDDTVIASQLSRLLEREGFGVDVVRDGDAAVDRALTGAYGLIVLDIMLPGKDGWQVCQDVRRSKLDVPVLMLTARDSVEDRIRGLEGGADDYLPKPFDVRELVARIRSLLRRDQVHRTGVIEIADLVVDTLAHTATRSGEQLDLTPREFTLLVALARNEGRTLTRQTILERVWDDEDSLENTVNFHVASLRKKVDAPYERKLIHTVHGIGYKLSVNGGGS